MFHGHCDFSLAFTSDGERPLVSVGRDAQTQTPSSNPIARPSGAAEQQDGLRNATAKIIAGAVVLIVASGIIITGYRFRACYLRRNPLQKRETMGTNVGMQLTGISTDEEGTTMSRINLLESLLSLESSIVSSGSSRVAGPQTLHEESPIINNRVRNRHTNLTFNYRSPSGDDSDVTLDLDMTPLGKFPLRQCSGFWEQH